MQTDQHRCKQAIRRKFTISTVFVYSCCILLTCVIVKTEVWFCPRSFSDKDKRMIRFWINLCYYIRCNAKHGNYIGFYGLRGATKECYFAPFGAQRTIFTLNVKLTVAFLSNWCKDSMDCSGDKTFEDLMCNSYLECYAASGFSRESFRWFDGLLKLLETLMYNNYR